MDISLLFVDADQIPDVWQIVVAGLVDLVLLVVFTNAAAVETFSAYASASSTSAAAGGLQPVKVVAPYGVSGVKLDNACPWLLYSCIVSSQNPEGDSIPILVLQPVVLLRAVTITNHTMPPYLLLRNLPETEFRLLTTI